MAAPLKMCLNSFGLLLLCWKALNACADAFAHKGHKHAHSSVLSEGLNNDTYDAAHMMQHCGIVVRRAVAACRPDFLYLAALPHRAVTAASSENLQQDMGQEMGRPHLLFMHVTLQYHPFLSGCFADKGAGQPASCIGHDT